MKHPSRKRSDALFTSSLLSRSCDHHIHLVLAGIRVRDGVEAWHFAYNLMPLDTVFAITAPSSISQLVLMVSQAVFSNTITEMFFT
jgi:hypothetical protein